MKTSNHLLTVKWQQNIVPSLAAGSEFKVNYCYWTKNFSYIIYLLGSYSDRLTDSPFREVDTFRVKNVISCTFLYPATLKSAGYYVIPSIQKIVCSSQLVRVSVCLSVCPSVSASFSLSAGSIF